LEKAPEAETRWDKGAGWGAAVVVFGLALFTMPQGLTDADNGEFLLVGMGGGIVHPPGYALYVFLLQMWKHLPLGLDPIIQMTLLSSFFGALAAWFLFRFCRGMGLSAGASLVATLAAFGAVPVWRMNTLVEPFALHHLLAAMVLWLTTRLNVTARDPLPTLWMGLVWGLSFCNHHAMVFLVPVVVLHVLGQTRERRVLLRTGAFFGLGFLFGLVPLASFFITGEGAAYVWGDWEQAGRLWTHLFRTEYGTFQWAAADANEKGFALGLKGFLRVFTLGMTLVGGITALFGMGAALRHPEFRNQRMLSSGLVCTLFIYVFIFLGVGINSCSDPLSSVLQRFLGLPFLLAAFFVGVGFEQCHTWASRHARQHLVSALAAVVLVFHCLWVFPLASRHDETFVHTHLENVSSLLEPGDVVVAQSDVEVFGLSYLRHQKKQDYTLISLWLYEMDWYKAQLAESLRMKISDMPKSAWDLAVSLNDKRRLVILDPRVLGGQEVLSQKGYPLGPVLIAPPQAQRTPGPVELFTQNKAAFEQTLRLPTQGWRSLKRNIERNFYFDYAFPWETLCQVSGVLTEQQEDVSCALAKKMNPDNLEATKAGVTP